MPSSRGSSHHVMLMMEGKGFFRGIWREREEQEQHLQEDLVVTVPRGPLLKSGPSPAGTAPQCCARGARRQVRGTLGPGRSPILGLGAWKQGNRVGRGV